MEEAHIRADSVTLMPKFLTYSEIGLQLLLGSKDSETLKSSVAVHTTQFSVTLKDLSSDCGRISLLGAQVSN